MPHTLTHVFRSRLFVLTSLPAVDGTLFALAAKGGLGSPAQAAFVGLAVIAGAGSWIAARREFGEGGDRRAFAAVAIASTLAAAVAAWVGATWGASLALAVFPSAAGLALLVLAADAFGVLRRNGGVAAFTLVAGGAVLEVVVRIP